MLITKPLERTCVAILLLFMVVVPLHVHAQTADSNSGHPRSPREIAGMDFLLGQWELATWFVAPDGGETPGQAQLVAAYVLDGMGIEVEQRFPSDTEAPDFVSTTTYVFNPRLNKIFGVGINTLGNTKTYEVRLEDNKVITLQSGMLFGGRPGINRITYHDIDTDSFEALFEHSGDDGETWVREFGYTAARIGQ